MSSFVVGSTSTKISIAPVSHTSTQYYHEPRSSSSNSSDIGGRGRHVEEETAAVSSGDSGAGIVVGSTSTKYRVIPLRHRIPTCTSTRDFCGQARGSTSTGGAGTSSSSSTGGREGGIVRLRHLRGHRRGIDGDRFAIPPIPGGPLFWLLEGLISLRADIYLLITAAQGNLYIIFS